MTCTNYVKQECELRFHRLAFKYDLKYDRVGIYFNNILFYRMNLEHFKKFSKELLEFSTDIFILKRKLYESED